ncbi:hypothetical protein ACH4UM_38760 [Streptomyces sp. NPDC020801]|uniref:hypothetical protein n=1 Tax=unclassified Streptomyces TaxID=2593676 RepID=UPI0037A5CD89
MRFRDFLARFRPAGTAGAAAAGVPADRGAQRAAELQPLFDLLDPAQDRAAAIRQQAEREAGRIRQEAGRQADEIVAGALARRAEVHEAGFAAGRGAVTEQADEIRRAGRSAAHRLRRRAESRMPALVDLVVQDAMRDLNGTGGPE